MYRNLSTFIGRDEVTHTRFITRLFGRKLLTFFANRRERIAQGQQVSNAAVNVRDALIEGVEHLFAWEGTIIPRHEPFIDFREAKAQAPRADNVPQTLRVRRGVLAVIVIRALSGWQEANLFVITNSFGGDASQLSEVVDK